MWNNFEYVQQLLIILQTQIFHCAYVIKHILYLTIYSIIRKKILIRKMDSLSYIVPESVKFHVSFN